jgi:hypothetical protein
LRTYVIFIKINWSSGQGHSKISENFLIQNGSRLTSAEAQPGIMKAEACLGGYQNILFRKKR